MDAPTIEIYVPSYVLDPESFQAAVDDGSRLVGE
jgi:hypothetical protein